MLLRPFDEGDVGFALELGTDPHVPLVGTLPRDPSPGEALDWVRRQQGRWAEGAGFAFAVADVRTGEALGTVGVWLRHLDEGWAGAGYAVRPSARGRGVARDALRAATRFAWTLDGVEQVRLEIEPWNEASVRTAQAAGYRFVRVRPRALAVEGELRDVGLYVADRPRTV